VYVTLIILLLGRRLQLHRHISKTSATAGHICVHSEPCSGTVMASMFMQIQHPQESSPLERVIVMSALSSTQRSLAMFG
jgi:hypothetical protein